MSYTNHEPMLTITTGSGLAFSVAFDRWDAFQHDRARWCWEIRSDGDSDHGEVIARGDDLTTVCPDYRPNIIEALSTLMLFAEMSPESCGAQWATMVDDGNVMIESLYELRVLLGEDDES